jgi:hypothetical protein
MCGIKVPDVTHMKYIYKRIQIPHINLYLIFVCVLGVVLQTILDVYNLFYSHSIVIP